MKKNLHSVLEAHLNDAILSIQPLQGGDTCRAFKLTTPTCDYFVKKAPNVEVPDLLATEQRNLERIEDQKIFKVPGHRQILVDGDTTYLLMAFFPSTKVSMNFWKDFGTKLARLHNRSSNHFGLDFDNFIGLLPQSNKRHPDWQSFYATERIIPQIAMARDKGYLGSSHIRSAESFVSKISELYPQEPTALLHGDLWRGNFICHQNEAVLIDPAVYYGHREMDLAMTRLFGGFDSSFYHYYREQYPLDKGWEKRIQYSQLYYLLVHLNLFGNSYLNQVSHILKPFDSGR